MSNNERKILLLQLRKHRKQFLSKLEIELLQKGSSKAHIASRKIKYQIQKDMKKNGWDYVPRAKLAASLTFFSNSPNIPSLPKLVKYLLDILCTTICSDDRQIGYIAACCYRPSAKKNMVKGNEGSVFIKVEKLTDYKNRFKLFATLMEDYEFSDYLQYNNNYNLCDDRDGNDIEDLWPKEEMAQLLNIPPNIVKQWHRMTIQKNQQKLLSINKLDYSDWPEGPRYSLYHMKEVIDHHNPFVFRIEGFPTKGGEAKYKNRLRAKLKELNKRYPSFGKIIAPLELDIQVSPKNGILEKDLDNIILHVTNAFSDELLESESYLRGYRIYMVKEPTISSINSLRFKLLPMYEINKFQEQINQVLNTGIKWLEDNIW